MRFPHQSGNIWPDISIPNPPTGQPLPESWLKNFGAKLREIRWNTNGKMKIRCGSNYGTDGGHIFTQTVYIGNIAAAAPAACPVRMAGGITRSTSHA